MAWVKNTSWLKEVQKILDAPTYDDQMKLALKYISHLGKKKQKEDDDFQRAFDASWENYEGI